jgi:hypothetical protein
MRQGLDPELRRQLATIKGMVSRTHQTPTEEWPLVFVAEHDALLVVREWPDGDLTAYATSDLRSET